MSNALYITVTFGKTDGNVNFDVYHKGTLSHSRWDITPSQAKAYIETLRDRYVVYFSSVSNIGALELIGERL